MPVGRGSYHATSGQMRRSIVCCVAAACATSPIHRFVLDGDDVEVTADRVSAPTSTHPELAAAMAADLSIHVVAAPDARFKIEQPVWSTQVTFVQWLGWVPVLEVADLSLGVGVDVDATAAVDVVLGGGVTAQVAAGVSYDGIEWQNL